MLEAKERAFGPDWESDHDHEEYSSGSEEDEEPAPELPKDLPKGGCPAMRVCPATGIVTFDAHRLVHQKLQMHSSKVGCVS